MNIEEARAAEEWREREYRSWCRSRQMDPEDVGSAIQYEEWVREMNTPVQDPDTRLWS